MTKRRLGGSRILGATLLLAVGLILGLAVVGCGDPDVISSYCNRHSYCFANYDYQDCMNAREIEQEEAIAQGQACHEAFLRFHKCIGELSCSDLDDYYADSEHCGSAYNAWQNSCLDYF